MDDRASEHDVHPREACRQQLATLEQLLDQLDAEEDAEDSSRGPSAPHPGWRDPPREKPRR